MDTKEQLKNVQQLRVVRYKYNPEFAKLVGLSEEDAMDTGVIAQEVQRVIPEAVKSTGRLDLPSGSKIENFLVVNKVKSRIINTKMVFKVVFTTNTRNAFSWKILGL
jgi:hypothetical protein